MIEMLPSKDELLEKIKTLNESIWDDRVKETTIREWLECFDGQVMPRDDEQHLALYLLSQFMYFGQSELRALLRSLYRDHLRAPMIARLRTAIGAAADASEILLAYKAELGKTAFLPLGNPSESSTHILYYFRQENRLGRLNFSNGLDLFKRGSATGSRVLSRPIVRRLVFVDDLLGSGSQAVLYAKDFVDDYRSFAPDVEVIYCALFGLQEGVHALRHSGVFDDVIVVSELDSSFRAVGGESRYFSTNGDGPALRLNALRVVHHYGELLYAAHPLGYKLGQLMLGLYHNTPDNTLPVFWQAQPESVAYWHPTFPRYPKIYGWGDGL